MRTESIYGQFCPIALAAEIVTERWTPLLLRELLLGSTRFNQLRRGLPTMSPSLLARRLKELEEHAIVTRHAGGGTVEYRLTPAGEALRPIIVALGHWGKQWIERDIRNDELDPSLLVWDMRRRVVVDALPEERVVTRIDFRGVKGRQARYWMIFDSPSVDVCFQDPGHEPDLYVDAEIRAMIDVWMGARSFSSILRDRSLVLDGPRELCRGFTSWFERSVFA